MAQITELIEREGWRIVRDGRDYKVEAEGQRFNLIHPANIHLKLYKGSNNPESKYLHLKAAHDYLWPQKTEEDTWNYWEERRFRAHCEGWKSIGHAGGASTGKSFSAAKLAILFWLANPKGRTVLVASTTLESLNSRVWGYVTKFLTEMAIDIPYTLLRGGSPKVLFDRNDTIHGMFAVAAARGDDDAAIRNWIGRHPKEGMLLILDEAPDLPMSILGALPNLESQLPVFQVHAIGNSLSKFDLHGSLCTPRSGWDSVNPMVDTQWETTQNKGVCLFYNCYESPAIHERNPEKKRRLEKFLISVQDIENKKKIYGEDSDSFFRFVLGFWRVGSAAETVISPEFIREFGVFDKTEWGGLYPLRMVAGLDPAFSTGGDGCVLRLAVLGVDVLGNVVLDFGGERLLFRIPIIATSDKSADLQIADQVISILSAHDIPLNHLVLDATGHGRALGEVIRLRAGGLVSPLKMFTVKGGTQTKESFDVIVKTPLDLWGAFRNFIQKKQIRGLDHTTVEQLTSRRIVRHDKTGKINLEGKSAYKARIRAVRADMGHSPDEADAAALCLQSAIINWGFHEGQRREMDEERGWVSDKFRAFKIIQQMEAAKEVKGAYSPKANFTGSIGDMRGCMRKIK